MYLAKLAVDPRHPSIRQALRDRQDMHRNLAAAYGTGFLYRLSEQKASPAVLVLSQSTSDEGQLASRGYHLDGIRDLSPLPGLYRESAVLRFDLMAAPSKKANEERGGNSRRVYLADPAQRTAWLEKQGQKYGFEVLEVHEPEAERTISVGRKTGAFLLTGVVFAGVLRITDADVFWAAWAKGIGPEKAYGMGLMLLSR